MSALQIENQSTPIVNTTTSTITAGSQMDLLKATPPVQTGTTTFGEYKTTTSINGIKSQYMPQIDAVPSFSTLTESKNVIAIPSSSPMPYTSQSTGLPSNAISTFGFTSNQPIKISSPVMTVPTSSSMVEPTTILSPVPTIPITTDYITPIKVPSVATVTPLKGSLAIGGRLIAQVTPMTQGNNIYSASTYRPNLRNRRKRSEHSHGFHGLSKHGRLYRPKDFNRHTYNAKSPKF